MKGVILNINPSARIVDISNAVQSYDVLDGAITISQAYPYFPKNTLHIVVVDPGVGTSRRPIIARTEHGLFLAPDNGVLSLVYEKEERVNVRHVTAEHYFLQPVSQTFHGRDVFAAVAGYLSKGVDSASFGEEIKDFVRFAAPRPKAMRWRAERQRYQGRQVWQPDYQFHSERCSATVWSGPAAFKVKIGKAEVTNMHSAYAEGTPGEVFVIVDSMGFLEIAMNRGAANRTISAEKGSEVVISF